MDDLASWLLEQIAEDERAVADLMEPERAELLVSRRSLHHSVVEDRDPHGAVRFRLAECDAKRKIIKLHADGHECSVYDENGEIDYCHYVHADLGDTCSTLRLLALPYAAHPGYRSEWAP